MAARAPSPTLSPPPPDRWDGRPPILPPRYQHARPSATPQPQVGPVKRGRGRPRKDGTQGGVGVGAVVKRVAFAVGVGVGGRKGAGKGKGKEVARKEGREGRGSKRGREESESEGESEESVSESGSGDEVIRGRNGRGQVSDDCACGVVRRAD